MIFSSKNMIIFLFLIFLIFYYYYYLIIFLIHAYLTQTAQVTAIRWCKMLPKILTLWVGRNNVTDDRHRRTAMRGALKMQDQKMQDRL